MKSLTQGDECKMQIFVSPDTNGCWHVLITVDDEIVGSQGPFETFDEAARHHAELSRLADEFGKNNL